MARTKKAPEASIAGTTEQSSAAPATGAEAAAPEPTHAPAPPKKKTVKARVLAACSYGQPNSVIEIDVELAAALSGVVDTDPEAVAYAESIEGA